MISEPYQTDDGRWWVKSHASGEVHNFATSEEAYHFYHRILEIQARLDGGSRTDLKRPPLAEPVKLPLSKVPETRPAHLDTPVMNETETREAYERATEAEIARIEYEKAKKGETPITFFFRKWLGPAIVGIASLAWLVKGCG